MYSPFARLALLGLWNPLCWVSLDLAWNLVLSLGRQLLWFFQSFCMKKLQTICSWIRFLISLVQFILLIMVELFRFCFYAFPCEFWILDCMLCFWVVLLYCDLLCLMWFAVFWLAPAILCLKMWLCIPFPPESVLWQFACSNDQCKSRVFWRVISASSPVLLSFIIGEEERIQFLSVVTRHGNGYTS